MRNWAQWHEDYDRPGSPLSRRLEVVRERLRSALNATPSPVLLSLCSGDGRDVTGVLADEPCAVARAVLVENDPVLAGRAARAAEQLGLDRVEVRCLDAGAVASFADVTKVDVLLLCGIFGNIRHRSVKAVVDMLPHLVNVGGHVIWTRGGSHPDRRPEIRRWFRSAGLEEIAFTGDPEPFGVGLNRLSETPPSVGALPGRLFSFE